MAELSSCGYIVNFCRIKELKSVFENLGLIASMDQIYDSDYTWDERKEILSQYVEKYGYIRLGIADLDGNLSATLNVFISFVA